MKKQLSIAVLLALLITAFAAPQSSWADSTQPYLFQREDAFAIFTQTDGCIRTEVQVNGLEYFNRVPSVLQDRRTYVAALIYQTNICAQQTVLNALGDAYVSRGDLKVLGNLRSAVLQTTITVSDAVSGNSFPVSLNINWEGTGDIVKERVRHRIELPECSAKDHAVYAYRPADASGSITFQGTTLNLASPYLADMASQKTHSTVKGCAEE